LPSESVPIAVRTLVGLWKAMREGMGEEVKEGRMKVVFEVNFAEGEVTFNGGEERLEGWYMTLPDLIKPVRAEREATPREDRILSTRRRTIGEE